MSSTSCTCGRKKQKGPHTDFHFTLFLSLLSFSFFPSLSLFIFVSLHMLVSLSFHLCLSSHVCLSLFILISLHMSLSFSSFLLTSLSLSRQFYLYFSSLLSLVISISTLSILRSPHLSSLLSHHYSLFLTLSSLPSCYLVMSLFFSQ